MRLIFLAASALLLLFAPHSASQSPEEMEARLESAGEQERVELLVELCSDLRRQAPDRAISYCRQALEMKELLPSPEDEVTALNSMAWAHMVRGEFDQALANTGLAQTRATELGYDSGRARSLSVAGVVHWQANDYASALQCHLESLSIREAIQEQGGMAASLNNIGIIYFNIGELDKALDYYLRSLRVRQEYPNPVAVANTTHNVGAVYFKAGNLELALDYFEQARAAHAELGNTPGLINAINGIGEMAARRGDFKTAIESFEQTLALAREIGSGNAECGALLLLGKAYCSHGDLKKAAVALTESRNMAQQLGIPEEDAKSSLELARVLLLQGRYSAGLDQVQRAISIAEEIATPELLRDCLELLAGLQEAAGEHTAALATYRRFSELKDTIFNDSHSLRIAALSREFESDTRKKEIELLTRDNRIKTLQVEQQRSHRNLLLAGVGVIILIAVIIHLRLLERRRLAAALQAKNSQLGAINQQLEEEMKATREATRARLAMESKMQESQRLESLGVLAGGIAHDFNNILAIIMGGAELAKLHFESRQRLFGDLDRIITASDRAAELCSQMLAYAGKAHFDCTLLDVNQVIREMLSLLRTSAGDDVTIALELAPELRMIEADRNQVEQLILNLVSNAAEAGASGPGSIRITTCGQELDTGYLRCTRGAATGSGPYVIIEVSDNGAGMEPEVLDKIFDPFFTTKFYGRGLGLAAVFGVLRTHQAAIEVTSELGKGSSFRVMFPARAAQVPAAIPSRPEKVQEPEQPVASGCILVIDDEEGIRSLARDAMELTGYEVITAENGRRGVSLLQSTEKDVVCVLLDMTMPEMDGAEALVEIRRFDRQVPVVIMSGYNESQVRSRFSPEQNASYLHKPFAVGQLHEVVFAAIREHRQGH